MSFATLALIVLGTGWASLSHGVISISHASLQVLIGGGA